MPKFQSMIVKEAKKDANGNTVQAGEIVLIPLDDAAMLEPVCDKAVTMGLIKKDNKEPYTHEEFKAKQEEIRKMFRERMKEDMRKRKPY